MESKRKLASIQKIIKLFPIEGADRIECAQVLGWECVVVKDTFKEGDLCVYFECDSQLPIHPVFEFMANRHYRVKTAKFKKQISQGLALPISILTNFADKPCSYYKEDQDVTSIIGVTKYDPRPENTNPVSSKKLNPIVNSLMQYALFRKVYRAIVPGKTKGNFPSFINKTDETRIQSCPSLLRKHINTPFYFTEKLDGSSATYFYNKSLVGKRFGIFTKDSGNGFGVCSRNLRLVHTDGSYWWHYVLNSNIKEKIILLSEYLKASVAIQGELLGPSIQENKYKVNNISFHCYNIFNIDTQEYLPYEDKFELCEKFNINAVPIVDDFILTDEHDVHFMVNLSKRKSVLNPSVLAEGIVGRSMLDDAISFKAINPEWLLKYKE